MKRMRLSRAVLWLMLMGGAVWARGADGDDGQWVMAPKDYAKWPLYVSTLACAGVAGWMGMLGWRQWRRGGGNWPSSDEGGVAVRAKFLGVLGVMSGVLFVLLILAQGAAAVMIDLCQD